MVRSGHCPHRPTRPSIIPHRAKCAVCSSVIICHLVDSDCKKKVKRPLPIFGKVRPPLIVLEDVTRYKQATKDSSFRLMTHLGVAGLKHFPH